MIATNNQKSPTRRLTILYISSLAVVACLSIAGQVVIQRLLSQQYLDIAGIDIRRNINISSRNQETHYYV